MNLLLLVVLVALAVVLFAVWMRVRQKRQFKS